MSGMLEFSNVGKAAPSPKSVSTCKWDLPQSACGCNPFTGERVKIAPAVLDTSSSTRFDFSACQGLSGGSPREG